MNGKKLWTFHSHNPRTSKKKKREKGICTSYFVFQSFKEQYFQNFRFILIGKLISTFVEFLSFCFEKIQKKVSLLKV